ncbi:hypothetical protein ACFUIY_14620 [Streptomyces griseorubiginosus]|uniref:hypothetical protein n=1 Tax=Streptomyces griseorubiginosus TaxID=67304 RepID=UPI00363D3FC5
MTKTALTWNTSLEDSVFALGAAARECQSAARAAAITTGHYDLDRLRLLDGKVHHGHSGYTGEQEPHLTALSRIGDVHLKATHRLKLLYEQAAEAYAHGANWAVRQVQAGQQPAHVTLKVDPDGTYLLGGSLPALELHRFASAKALEGARQAYERCLVAGWEAEGIGRQDYVSDHEAGEMHAALDMAGGLPDAAYAYGVLAESALRWALTTSVTRQ